MAVKAVVAGCVLVLLAGCSPGADEPAAAPEPPAPTAAAGATSGPAPADAVPAAGAPGEAAPPVAGAACGVQRWAVKTGTDAAAAGIALGRPHPATVAALAGLPAPYEPSARVPPVETTVYRVAATLTAYKEEGDSDYHLVLLDPGTGATMLAEIPAPYCVGARSPLRAGIARARAAFDERFTVEDRFRRTYVPVTVTGVGFFDTERGQRGVAPNGIELHPVLAVTFGG